MLQPAQLVNQVTFIIVLRKNASNVFQDVQLVIRPMYSNVLVAKMDMKLKGLQQFAKDVLKTVKLVLQKLVLLVLQDSDFSMENALMFVKLPVNYAAKIQRSVLLVKMDTLSVVRHVMLQQHAIRPMSAQRVLMDKCY